jgi:hypothetical protein
MKGRRNDLQKLEYHLEIQEKSQEKPVALSPIFLYGFR